MPSTLHEALIEIFRQRPAFAAQLLTDAMGIDIPAYHVAQLVSSDLTDVIPTEYRADAVVMLTSADGAAVLAVVIEVQLGRDRDKQWSWPVYLTTLRARLRCPTVLLVLCVKTNTAAWCATPIKLGHPGWTLTPLVLGPDRVPVVTDVHEAIQAPEMAVLSAMAHGASADRDKILSALLGALGSIEQDRATMYIDVVFAALPKAAHRYLEELMTSRTYEYQSDFVRRFVFQGRAEGRVEGEAKAVLTVLDARGIQVPDDARTRITECSDLDQLDTWVRRATTADSINDLFD